MVPTEKCKIRKTKSFTPKEIRKIVEVIDDDADVAWLELAKLRRNDEMTNSQDFKNFLKSLP